MRYPWLFYVTFSLLKFLLLENVNINFRGWNFILFDKFFYKFDKRATRASWGFSLGPESGCRWDWSVLSSWESGLHLLPSHSHSDLQLLSEKFFNTHAVGITKLLVFKRKISPTETPTKRSWYIEKFRFKRF